MASYNSDNDDFEFSPSPANSSSPSRPRNPVGLTLTDQGRRILSQGVIHRPLAIRANSVPSKQINQSIWDLPRRPSRQSIWDRPLNPNRTVYVYRPRRRFSWNQDANLSVRANPYAPSSSTTNMCTCTCTCRSCMKKNNRWI